MKVPKSYLKKFSIIEEECTAIVQAMQTIDKRFFIDDANPRYLVPLLAFSKENEEYIDDIIQSSEGKTFELEDLYPFLFTGVLWEDKVLHKLMLPVKGESLIATFTYGDLDELECSGLVPMGKIKPKKYKPKKYE